MSYFCKPFNCFPINISVVADKGGSSKGKVASARASLCGSREGGVSGEDLEVGAAAADIHKDSAVEKLPAADATQRAGVADRRRGPT